MIARGRVPKGLALGVLAVALLTGCAGSDQEETIEYKLAAIHGDTSKEAEFSRILDRIQVGGQICNPEPDRERAADVIVGSWEQSGERESLLAWATALADACS